ncbi:MAG: hypothetical protein O9337_09155 [Acidovorax sp.]|uniref:ShlB/FhaC/HecB family hemolysin secretion/activation protein n=1 Tax=Acidovorax sp. TaxID=1872122 RepID=UPI0022C57965|nr:POTRA domain-containing protein [Acidovorax sp.]MCZ8219573.1 hypothetical protein [Acidovorax sp.]
MQRAPTTATLLLAWLATSPGAWAAPDAGRLIQQYREDTVERMKAPAAKLPSAAASKQEVFRASDEQIHIAGFEVHGVTRFSDEEIAQVLRPYTGRPLDTAGIHAAADALNHLYRAQGYFLSKVFIPPQAVSDAVRLDVFEGEWDAQGLEIVNKGHRVDTRVVRAILERNIPQGAPARRADVERALLLAEDLPGVSTASSIYPGARVGTARLRTELTDLPALQGNIDYDNHGSATTGEHRLGTTLYWNSPTGRGDQITTRLATTGSRSQYGYINYLLPISPSGTRIGFSADRLNYDTHYIANVGYASGQASDLRVYLTYPIVRSRHGNLNFRGDVSRLTLKDRNDLQFNAHRTVDTAVLALQGDDDHPWLTTGLTTFDMSLTAGQVRIRGNANFAAADATTTQTAGGFARLNLDAARLTRLDGHWSVLSKVRAQWASHNLDSSQRFYLGGATSVSGYPQGEASGDMGAEYGVELRRDITAPWHGTLQVGAFVQQGWSRVHKHAWPGWNAGNHMLKEELSLTSVGINALATVSQDWVARASIGWQLGSNPLRDPATGAASDQKTRKLRLWAQVVRYF